MCSAWTGRLAKVRLDATLYRQAEQVLGEIQRLRVGGETPRLTLNGHCPVCEFRQRCRTQAEEADDISLLGISEKELRRLMLLMSPARWFNVVAAAPAASKPLGRNRSPGHAHVRLRRDCTRLLPIRSRSAPPSSHGASRRARRDPRNHDETSWVRTKTAFSPCSNGTDARQLGSLSADGKETTESALLHQQQERFAPTAAASFHGDTVLAGMLF